MPWEHKAHQIIVLHGPVDNILVKRDGKTTPISTLEAEGYEMMSTLHDQRHDITTGIFKRFVETKEK
jgi:hypothetical protein